MNRQRAVEIALRVVPLGLSIGCAAYALAQPQSIFFGGAAWLVVLAVCLDGFGHAVQRLIGAGVDLGLRMAWGAATYIVLAGVFLALGALTRDVVAGLLVIGFGCFVWRQLTVPRPILRELEPAIRGVRQRPMTALFVALIAAVVLVNLAGAIAEVQGNAYDDDIVYTPLIKRTLDVGDIEEPFSFRRISAYGGQTALGALAAVRGTLANIFLVDGALCQLIVLLLVIGMVRDRRRQDVVAQSPDTGGDAILVGLLLLVLVLLPRTHINTGSHWSGVVMFLALYRTAALTDGTNVPLARTFALLGVLAAAAATLRQNLLPVAVLFPAFVLASRLGPRPREAFRTERRLWIATFVGGLVALLPYCVASYRSNETFLYPFWSGTFNPEIQMQPTLLSAWQELLFFLRVLIEPEPFRVMLFVLPILFLARDTRRGRPLTALTLASIVGFVLLVHSFTLSDPRSMWRYAFGYMCPLFVVLVVEASAAGLRQRVESVAVRVPLLGRVALVVALLVQLAMTARVTGTKYAQIASDVDFALASHRHPARPLQLERTYAELQRTVPAGATLAILLDYQRNRIINIDTPGFASLAPGMPSFQGPDALAEYFRGIGVRHLAFVRGDASRYFYRRDMWVRRMLVDTELFRILGAYLVDCVDNFEALAREHRVLYENHGMVLLDLGEPP